MTLFALEFSEEFIFVFQVNLDLLKVLSGHFAELLELNLFFLELWIQGLLVLKCTHRNEFYFLLW